MGAVAAAGWVAVALEARECIPPRLAVQAVALIVLGLPPGIPNTSWEEEVVVVVMVGEGQE